MKQIFKKISLLLLAFVAIISVVFATGCGENQEPFKDQGEVGTYYAYNTENATFSLNENKFTIVNGNETLAGTYTFDGKDLAITFDGDTTAVKVEFSKLYVQFTYKGTTYAFYGEADYAVKFNTNGGTAVADKSVKNGNKVEKPADPVKEGYKFINWYKDDKFTSIFNFDTERITADTTIYARFEMNTNAADEFTVDFVTGVEAVKVDSTISFHNTLYSLPVVNVEGKVFLGWWVSQYNDPTKLSYQFKELMDIKQNITLYAVYKEDAPAVTYCDGRIEWDNKGVNKQYAVNVKLANDAEADPIFTKRVTENFVEFDFSNYAAADYVIEVQSGDYTGRAYYCNKLLSQVCKISVDGFKLSWNKVENATNYVLTIDVNDKTKNQKLDLGDVNEFDFSDIDMPATGINFTITAEAEEFYASVSKTVNEYKELVATTNVKLEVKDGKQLITWDAVTNAQGYTLIIEDAAGQKVTTNVTEAAYDVSEYYGTIKVTVTPSTKGYFGKEAAADLNKTILVSPKNIAMSGYEVTWDAVKDAVKYNIKVGTKSFTANTNSLTLSASDIPAGSSFVITIQAVAAEEANNSFYSADATVNMQGVTSIAYANGTISWNSVAGITKYAVKVDNEAVQIVEGKTNAAVAIKGGKHTIYVTTADANGTYNATFDCKYDVTVYALNFNAAGGNEVESLYFVKGDNIPAFGTTEKPGYDFDAWYNVDAQGASNGTKFTDKTYNFEKDITVIAGYTGHVYNVSFDYDVYATGENKGTATYNQSYAFPVPTSEDTTKVFAGWYSEKNGQGFKYTDALGKSVTSWKDYNDVTLYAYWTDVFTFTLINNGTEYSVSKGPGIELVTEIRIPAKYNELPVTTVEASGFQSCSTLVNVYLPNTIKNVEVGSAGPNGTGSCFQSCTKLENVFVYEVEGAIAADVKYSSIDGVLIYQNDFTGGIEIKYFPYNTRTGTYTIPSTVTYIPINAFRSCSKLEEIIIPASVTTIGDNAFYLCSKLKTITFLEAEQGTDEVELTLGAAVFQSNTVLEVINLPARITTFSTDVFKSCNALKQINVVGTYAGAKYKSVNGALTTLDGSELIYVPRGTEGVYTTPVGVTKIGENAFESCKYITEINITGQIAEIGKTAFKSCTVLEKINFLGAADDTPLTIKEQAFYGCTVLTEVTLPMNLVKLEKNAFGGCTKLTKVNVLAVSASIDFATDAFGTTAAKPVFYVTDLYLSKDVHAFDITGVFGAEKLANVVVDAENTNYTAIEGVLYDNAITKVVYYPTAREGAYTLPDTIVEIGDKVFFGKSIEQITINKNVTKIGISSFESCKKLTSVVFEDGGTEDLVIDNRAFYQCTLITTISFPSRLKSIGTDAFRYCSGITSIVLPEGITSVGDYAFASCSKATSITIPATLATLPETTSTLTNDTDARIRVFDYTTYNTQFIVAEGNPTYTAIDGILYKKVFEEDTLVSLELVACPCGKEGVVSLPKNISKLCNHAFYNCDAITEVKFPEGVENPINLNNYAFYDCKVLAKIELPEGLKHMYAYGIYSCPAVTEIVIPKTVIFMETKAIYSCSALTTVTFAEGGTEALYLGDGTYTQPSSSSQGSTTYYGPIAYCNKVTSLVLPERLAAIGDYAFATMGLTSINIPSTVTTIGNGAFRECKSLSQIVVAENSQLQSIGTYAFYYCPITSFVIPEGVTEVGANTFYYCQKLTTVTLPSTLKSIGNYGFGYATLLATINMAENMQLESIGNYAFAKTAITSFVIPQTVKTIGTYAFTTCANLASITFATKEVIENEGTENQRVVQVASIEQINQNAFAGTAITSFTFPYTGKDASGNVNTITLGTKSGSTTTVSLFSTCKKLTDVHISQSVVSLTNLFNGCASVNNVTIDGENENFAVIPGKPIIMDVNKTTIKFMFGRVDGVFEVPEGVTTIEPYAFAGQTNITKIVLPMTLKSIGNYAFQNCLSLEEVEFNSAANILTFGTNAFMNCYNLKKVTLPTSLETLPDRIFQGCINLTQVTLPTNLTSVGSYAFAGCKSLTSIDLPSTVNTVNTYAFAYCGIKSVTIKSTISYKAYAYEYSDLETVVIEEGVSSLLGSMFLGCEKLVEAELSSTLATPSVMFSGCTSLKKVTIKNPAADIGSSMFKNCVNLETLILPENWAPTAIGEYGFYNCTKLDLSKFELPATVKTIGSGAFALTNIENVTFGSALTKIGASTSTTWPIATPSATGTYYGAFEKCTNLKTVDFTNATALTQICYASFEGCSQLTEVTIPAKVTIVNTAAFANCDNLTKIEILAKLTTFGTYFAANCPKLATVTMADTNTTMPNYGFLNDVALESFTFPKNVTTTGTYTFQNCTNLTSVTFPTATTFKTVGSYAFANTGLTNVVLGNNVTSLGAAAFMGCQNLETVELGTNIKTMGTGSTSISATTGKVFMDCPKLTTVTIKSTAFTTIGNETFRNCTSLKTFTIPSTTTTIGLLAFYNSGITALEIPAKVATMYGSAFNDCADLKTFSINAGNTKFAYQNGAVVQLSNSSILSVIGLSGDVVIPEGLTLGNKALIGCEAITSVTLPTTLVTIPTYAFYQSSIKKVVLNANTTATATYAFAESAIEEVVGSEYLTTIETYTFNKCANLKNFTFSDSLAAIKAFSFAETALTSVTLPASLQFIGSTATDTSGKVFFNCKSLETVTLSEGLTYIASYAFDGTAIKSIVLPSTLTSMGTYVFAECADLESIEIKGQIEKIPTYTFYNCKKLANVTLPDSITVIDTHSFEFCESLKGIKLPNDLTTIQTNAFNGCGLESITIPSNVVNIFAYAFANNANLKTVVLNEGLVTLGVVNSGSAVQSSGYVFQNCVNLESINIPSTLDSIGQSTFDNCTKLASIVLPQTLRYCADAFHGWTSAQKVYVEASLYDVISSWYVANFTGGAKWYQYDTDAQFVYEYEAPAID